MATTACAELGLISVMKALVEQLVLLSDHLCQPQQRCHDCIQKHFLTSEAFLEEAMRAALLRKKPVDGYQHVMDKLTEAENMYLELTRGKKSESLLCNVAEIVTKLANEISKCTLHRITPAIPRFLDHMNDLPQCSNLFPKSVQRALSPILHPNFNLRQACKELIWLQMLLNMRCRCKCSASEKKLRFALIRHMTILHGLLDECVSLTATPPESAILTPKELGDLIDYVNKIEHELYSCNLSATSSKKLEALMLKIRTVRKQLQPSAFSGVRISRFGGDQQQQQSESHGKKRKAVGVGGSCEASGGGGGGKKGKVAGGSCSA